MRRIKVILAVVAAVATMMVLAAPAMASHRDGSSSISSSGTSQSFSIKGSGSSGVGVVRDGLSVGGLSLGGGSSLSLDGGDIELVGGSVHFG